VQDENRRLEYALVGTEACDPNLFYSENRLHDDGCFKQDRERQSSSVGSYLTAGLVPQGNCGEDVAKIACTPIFDSKRFGCIGVCDRRRCKMRFGATQTNPRHRQQLQTRTTVTPTTRGCLAPDIESDLIHTEGTRTSRPGVLSGIEIDRFEPLIPCISEVVQDPQHIVNDRSGTNTRAWVRDEDYIKKCGFTRWTRMETLKFTFLREERSA
jgi:hypothetical protein